MENEKSKNVYRYFQIGDWIVNQANQMWRIERFDRKYYHVSNGHERNRFPIIKQNTMHLWSVYDAKNGDILTFNNNSSMFFLFKNLMMDDMFLCSGWMSTNDNRWYNSVSIWHGASRLCPVSKEMNKQIKEKIQK